MIPLFELESEQIATFDPKVISVIESYQQRGNGSEDHPYRQVRQYHTTTGKFLAEYDDWKETIK